MIITEDHNSPSSFTRNSNGELSATRTFKIQGIVDPFDADILGPQPGDFYGKFMQVTSRGLQQESTGAQGKDPDPGVYNLDVGYQGFIPDPFILDNDEVTITLDTSAQQAHIDRALSQDVIDGPIVGRNPGILIGVNDDNVDGVDIYIPQQALIIETDVPVLTQDKRQFYKELSGVVNDRDWKGYEPGEVLYLGAVSTKRGNQRWRVSHKFLINENTFEKTGWQYIWFTRRREVDTGNNIVNDKILNTYVATVYDAGNFMLLGLGV